MTNADILKVECAKHGVAEEVHTYARWKQLGYKVKSGEKALFSTRLWKIVNKSASTYAEREETAEVVHNMYMCKAYLFGKSQVEKVEAK
jgi:hypothetical protein